MYPTVHAHCMSAPRVFLSGFPAQRLSQHSSRALARAPQHGSGGRVNTTLGSNHQINQHAIHNPLNSGVEICLVNLPIMLRRTDRHGTVHRQNSQSSYQPWSDICSESTPITGGFGRSAASCTALAHTSSTPHMPVNWPPTPFRQHTASVSQHRRTSRTTLT